MSQVLRSITQFRNPERNKSRRTLKELHVSANDYNQLVPTPMTEKNVKEGTIGLDKTFRVIPVIDNPLEKENFTVRRSKRKNAVLDGASEAEPPKEVPPSKNKKPIVGKKPSKGKKGAAKKGETKLLDTNQSTLNAFVSASKLAEPEVPVSSESNGLQSSASNKNGGLKEIIADCAQSPTDTNFLHKSSSDGIDLVSSEASEAYWRELAEQRRIALDKTLYENAQLYDQLEVLQTENSQLKSLLEECETVIQSIQSTLD